MLMSMIGVDEVGRGCWAGPLLVVAFRQTSSLPERLTDSKKMSLAAREGILADVLACGDVGHGWVEASEIDIQGLTTAMRLGVDRALSEIGAQYNEPIVVDGNVNYCAEKFTNAQTVIRADARYPAVSAASVVAKVLRDRFMTEQAKQYPHYGFDKHVGYGTRLHRDRLLAYGPCLIHRKSYKPIRALQ